MTPELIIFGLLLVLICAGFVALFLRAFYHKKFVNALVLKACASICFVTLGAISAFSGNVTPTKLLIFIGLCLGIFGDELIALCQVFPKHDSLAFIGGGSFFLCGHVLYAVALLLLGEASWLTLVASFLVISAISAIYTKRKGSLIPEMKTPLTLYLMIIVFVAAVSVGVFFRRFTLGASFFALAMLLFVASDNILFAYKYGTKPTFIQNVLLHAYYYSAQLLIAFSISYL